MLGLWVAYDDSAEFDWRTGEWVYDDSYVVGIVIVALIWLALWIWQIFDARRVCRETNW